MPNILICDDDRDIVNALKIYLSDPDYTLFGANNGKEALDVISDNDIHLILLDVMMPVMDGITAMAKIREKSNLPIILLTAKSEDTDKINEYSEVLVRQSEKLKRLLEDLVEASKASTGNLDVLLSPCDASTFITQTCGEYEERMKTAELALVTKLPEKELVIMADGRRMWRVFDNLMNNICKYSLPGTRVYLSLEERDGDAVFDFKNTSREPLDMTEDELTERFTRGDSSRNTEGNGLGLSIAKSMAELQGGSLRLSTDGDLFKATLSFPTVR